MLGQTAFDENVRVGRASFFLGIGVMGAIAGLGIGSKQPNKLALLISAGSLLYANYLNPVFTTDPEVSKQFSRVTEEAREDVRSRLPFGRGGGAPAPTRGEAEARFRF